jgi:flagellar basal-body rod protein FlgB
MAVTDLPIVSALRTRLHWHQTRQKVLAENVANANTPGFQPRDLRAISPAQGPGAGLPVARTSPVHLASAGAPVGPEAAKAARYETRPSGNAVSLEDEMLKVADNQSDYQLAASLYQKSLAMLRTAVTGRA